MATNKTMTNTEVLEQVAALSEAEAAKSGIAPEMVSGAKLAIQSPNPNAFASSYFAEYTPAFNAFCGFIVQTAIAGVGKADYKDLYHQHHKGLVKGLPAIGFLGKAKAGTGNSSQLVDSTPATGSLTTLTTADMPDMITMYTKTFNSFEARVPISREDVTDAFDTETGIADLIARTREALEDKITDDINDLYDDEFKKVFAAGDNVSNKSYILAEGDGSDQDDNNEGAATFTVAAAKGPLYVDDYANYTDDDLIRIYVKLLQAVYDLKGRPITTTNAMGVPNNAGRKGVIVYVNSDLAAEMTARIRAGKINPDDLYAPGVEYTPLRADWLSGLMIPLAGTGLEDVYHVCAVALSGDWIRDWRLSDFGDVVPTGRKGAIEERFVDVALIRAGYEPAVGIAVHRRLTKVAYSSSNITGVTLYNDPTTSIINAAKKVTNLNAYSDSAVFVKASSGAATHTLTVYGDGEILTSGIAVSVVSGTAGFLVTIDLSKYAEVRFEEVDPS